MKETRWLTGITRYILMKMVRQSWFAAKVQIVALIRQNPLMHLGSTVRVKCFSQEHLTMSPARARTRTARSGDERTNHESTAPPQFGLVKKPNSNRALTKCQPASSVQLRHQESNDYHAFKQS